MLYTSILRSVLKMKKTYSELEDIITEQELRIDELEQEIEGYKKLTVTLLNKIFRG